MIALRLATYDVLGYLKSTEALCAHGAISITVVRTAQAEPEQPLPARRRYTDPSGY